MPLTISLEKAQFALTGAEFEPTDLAWALATPLQRKGYWRQVAVLARDRKYAELSKGLGVDGRRLPGRKRPRPDHAAGPVLSPHWSDSRFRTHLRWEGTDKGAVLWWRFPWGRIVGYHARGEVRGAPVRNVIGLAIENQRWVAEKARKWWAGQGATGRLGAGVTTMAGDDPLIARATAAGTFSGWHRVPPPRPAGSLFAPPVKPRPALTVRGPIPPWTLQQRALELWEAAGHGQATRADLERAARSLGRTQSLPTLQGLLQRWGVMTPVRTKAEATDLIRRNLLSRLTPRRGGDTGPVVIPPKPKPPKPVVIPPKPEVKPLQVQKTPKPKPTLDETLRAAVVKARQAGPVAAGKPIAERIKQYTWGDAKLAAIAKLAAEREKQALALNKSLLAIERQQIKAILARDQVEVALNAASLAGQREGLETLRARYQELAETALDLARQRATLDGRDRRLADELRERIRMALALDPADRLTLERTTITPGAASDAGPLADVTGDLADRIDKALAWLGSLTRRGDGDSRLRLRVGHGPGYRAHCRTGLHAEAKYDIQLASNSTRTTIAHEFAHAIDDRVGTGPRRVIAATLEYLNHRVGTEPPQKLADLFPDGGFGPDEMGREDGFEKAFRNRSDAFYCGKDYRGDASELLSMGVQLFHDDPAGFAKRDPEFCKFILGVLDGSLR